MTMTKYDLALQEIRSVLSEWVIPGDTARLSTDIVDRLVAKGVIQSTDPDDLVAYRTGPLQPGRTVIGGDDALVPEHPPQPGSVQRSNDDDDFRERFQEAKEWTLREHGETLRRLGEEGGWSDEAQE